MFTERSRTSSHSMTNRRKSDGADKAKPGKRSFLPFLRSKLKDTDAYGMFFCFPFNGLLILVSRECHLLHAVVVSSFFEEVTL